MAGSIENRVRDLEKEYIEVMERLARIEEVIEQLTESFKFKKYLVWQFILTAGAGILTGIVLHFLN